MTHLEESVAHIAMPLDTEATHQIYAPASGAELAVANWMTPAQVSATALALRAAQSDWESVGPVARGQVLARFGSWLGRNQAELEDLLRSETGKSRADAAVEIPLILQALSFYGRNAAKFMKPESRSSSSVLIAYKRVSVTWRPRQLVGIISPWNYPVFLPLVDAIPALAAGCSVLIKPSELTPLTLQAIVRGWRAEIGAPAVLDIAVGGKETGEALIDAADFVQFTGSSRTGRAVMARAAETLTPVSLELGGKDPMLVLADADIKRAARGAVWGAMFNAGQTCVSVERVYVHERVYDAFVSEVVKQVEGLTTAGPAADVGAMISEQQLAVVDNHVQQAIAEGARTLTGGHRLPGPGIYYAPTVLVDVRQEMACMQEETFGPTLPIMMVHDDGEAIGHANDSPYGLSASVWSKDAATARKVAQQLDCGAVNINDVFVNMFSYTAPQGGWKQSGIGSRLGGAAGLRKFCQSEAIVHTRITPRSEPNWYGTPARLQRLTPALLGAVARFRLRRLGK